MKRHAQKWMICAALAVLFAGCAEANSDNSRSTPSLNITPAENVTLTEGMDSVTFDILSNTVPFDELHISVTADDPTQIEISPDSLEGYLYPNPKSVSVRCVDDSIKEGNHTVSLTFSVTADDPDYDGMTIVREITCVDNATVKFVDDFCPDDPNKTDPGVCGCGIEDNEENTALTDTGYAKCLMMYAPDAEPNYGFEIINPDGNIVSEDGYSEMFAFALSEKPNSDVVVSIVSSAPTEGDVDIHEVTFTPETWSEPQFITVFGVDDNESDGDSTFYITMTASSEDPGYSNAVSSYLVFECLDDEPAIPNIILSTKEVSVYENGVSGDLYLKLATRPGLDEAGEDAEVVVEFTSNNAKEARAYPKTLTFTAENWHEPQVVSIKGMEDNKNDGNQKTSISMQVTSNEVLCENGCYNGLVTAPIQVEVIDIDVPAKGSEIKTANVRIMAANTTSGNAQSYDPGEGARIFRGLKPDIVLIQEFNYKKNTIASFVKSTFGDEYSYVRGIGAIPNGIISRYPIIQSGAWESNQVLNRQWDWAVIDLPGERDLLAVSVHLHTSANAQEMGILRNKIDKKMERDNRDYYVILGGDFNQPSWTPIRSNFGTLFNVGKKAADWPIDQQGKTYTNANRTKMYDYLLCSADFCKLEIPTVIGSHSYPKGHVVDSRVYGKVGELSDIAPVQAGDSSAKNMQHMAVVRDFQIEYTE